MNVVDLHEPMSFAYKNVQSDYWTTEAPPIQPIARPPGIVDPRLCVPCGGPAFYTPFGDPRYIKQPGGGIQKTTPGATPTGMTGSYIAPTPLLPQTSIGPALSAGTQVPTAAVNGGQMPNRVDEIDDIFAQYQPVAEQAYAEAKRIGQQRVPVWAVVVGLLVLGVLRR
jgi:hypothetical protein